MRFRVLPMRLLCDIITVFQVLLISRVEYGILMDESVLVQ